MADDARSFCSSCQRCENCGSYGSDCECCPICGSDYCDCCSMCGRSSDDCTCCVNCGGTTNKDEPRCEDCLECVECCSCEKEEEEDDSYLDTVLEAEADWPDRLHNPSDGLYVIEKQQGWMGPQECTQQKNIVHSAVECDYHIGSPWYLIHHTDHKYTVTLMSTDRDRLFNTSAERHNAARQEERTKKTT